MTLKEMAKKTGLTRNTLYQRIIVHGWDPDMAGDMPTTKEGSHKYKGKYYTCRELAKLNGTITMRGMQRRLRSVDQGILTMEEAVELPNRTRLKRKRCDYNCFECKQDDCILD